MAGDLKKVDRLLTFARENGEEELKTYRPYCNLKTKPKVHNVTVLKLIKGLRDIFFDDECIYWCNRINGKCGNLEDQYLVLCSLIVSYYNKNHNHALVIKYGHEAVSLVDRFTNRKELPLPKYQIYFHLGHASQVGSSLLMLHKSSQVSIIRTGLIIYYVSEVQLILVS